jgi:hypothetical protein
MDIKITMMNHDTLDRKIKEAYGICWRSQENKYHITIDEFFVQECYSYFVLDQYWSTWEINGETLEEVICHELAHIRQWNHCKKHREITQELLNSVTLPEKYYTYLKGA